MPPFSHDQAGLAHIFPNEHSSSMSGNSRTISGNNTSRDLSHRVDPNTSGKRTISSKANLKNHMKSQKIINEDILLIERIEAFLNPITLNHNKVCPFCGKCIRRSHWFILHLVVMNLKRSNFQNISSFFSQNYNRYYLTHFDCYLKSRGDEIGSKISTLLNLGVASIQSKSELTEPIDPRYYKKVGRKPYFIKIEGYHPISSYLLFKIEKDSHAVENMMQVMFFQTLHN